MQIIGRESVRFSSEAGETLAQGVRLESAWPEMRGHGS